MSVDRLKVAHTDSFVHPSFSHSSGKSTTCIPVPSETPVYTQRDVQTPQTEIRRTRSGRQVHWPARYVQNLA